MLSEPGDDAAHENHISVHATSYDGFLPQVSVKPQGSSQSPIELGRVGPPVISDENRPGMMIARLGWA